jgi:hypothetical protein
VIWTAIETRRRDARRGRDRGVEPGAGRQSRCKRSLRRVRLVGDQPRRTEDQRDGGGVRPRPQHRSGQRREPDRVRREPERRRLRPFDQCRRRAGELRVRRIKPRARCERPHRHPRARPTVGPDRGREYRQGSRAGQRHEHPLALEC